jgi:hypothetical protein
MEEPSDGFMSNKNMKEDMAEDNRYI